MSSEQHKGQKIAGRRTPGTSASRRGSIIVAVTIVIAFLTLATAADAKKWSAKGDACARCDKSKCPVLGPVPVQYCPPHSIITDGCGCCERCTALIVVPTSAASKVHPCTNVTCPSRQICMVNIQGLPVCRCPTEQMCRDYSPRLGKVCAADGSIHTTFPSECHMRVAMCASPPKRMKFLHRGACYDPITDDPLAMGGARSSKVRDAHGAGAAQASATATAAAAVTTATTPMVTTASTTPTVATTRTATPPPPKPAAILVRKTTQQPMIAYEIDTLTAPDTGYHHASSRGRQSGGRSPRVHEPGKAKEGRRRDRATKNGGTTVKRP